MKYFLSWVEIDKQALRMNALAFRKIIGPNVKFMAVVKGNAYGHGISEVAYVLKDEVDWFGVNNLEEALVLKNLGIKKPILILGYTPRQFLLEVVKNGFRQVVYDAETAIQLFKLLNYKPKIHLKIETGTNRQGIEGEELSEIVKILVKNPNIEIEGAYTHFANVEESKTFSFPRRQIEKFEKEIKNLEKNGLKIPVKHIACTAATMLLPQSYFNMVRVGIGLYGLWPSKLSKQLVRKMGSKFDLNPVLSWKSRVVQIKKVNKGETIGYGRSFKAKKELKIAVLPVGYYDGFDRHLSNIGRVLIRGQYASVVGRVMMNMTIVDITDIPNVKVEDEVVLIGRQEKNRVTVEELAEKVGTINYEIVTRINPSLPRIVV